MLNFLIVYVCLFTIVGHILLIQKLFRTLLAKSAVKNLRAAPAVPAQAARAEQPLNEDGEDLPDLQQMMAMFEKMNLNNKC